jgi:Spy/CpxP family protein refolding chaperone
MSDSLRQPRPARRTRIRAFVAGCLAFALIAMSPAIAHGQAATAPRPPWWQDHAVQRDLHLSRSQVQALEATFQRDRPQRIDLRRKTDALDLELQQAIARGDVDDMAVIRMSNRVEQLRAKRNIRRTLMLLAMNRILTPDQREKLTARGKSLLSHPPAR